MVILVTGATGRLGREVVSELLSRKKKVRVLATSEAQARKLFGKKVEIVEGDLSSPKDFEKIHEACKGVDSIIHLAGLVDYSASEARLISVNYAGTAHLVKEAESMPKRPRFVFVSSTSIYRGTPDAVVSEGSKPAPVNAYGRSKLAAELIVQASSLSWVILRPSMVYGASFSEGFGEVARFIREGKMRILGDGKNFIPFVHAKDLVRAILLALDSKKGGEAFIITSGEEYTQQQLYSMVAKELGVAAPSKHVSLHAAKLSVLLSKFKHALFGGKSKLSEEYLFTLSRSRRFDISKAKKLLGYCPSIKLREGLKEFVKRLP